MKNRIRAKTIHVNLRQSPFERDRHWKLCLKPCLDIAGWLQVLGMLFTVCIPIWLNTGCRESSSPEKNTGANAPRIVSLAPSLTEIICALDGQPSLIGRTTACDYPPKVTEEVPAIAGFGKPSLEKLASVNPDKILYTELAQPGLLKQMDELDFSIQQVQCSKVADIPRAVKEVGEAVNRKGKAESLSARLATGLTKLRIQSRQFEKRPSVYVEIWKSPKTTAGRDSFVNDLVSLAGGRNIAENVDKQYFRVTPEWVVKKNPEVILCLYMSENKAISEEVKRRPGWEDIEAVREGRVYADFDNAMILRPGPRILKGVRQLKSVIRQ